MTSPLDHARELMARGYRVGPVPHRTKGSILLGWPDLRLGEADLPRYFNGHPMNIAVLTGAASGGRVDVDVDHELAVALADSHLPPTGAVWGRKSKPKSHRIYICDIPSEQFQAVRTVTGSDGKAVRETTMIVEIRANRLQSLAPGSTHPSGEVVCWDTEGEPVTIEAGRLREAVRGLADAAFEAGGFAAAGWSKSWEKPARSTRKPTRKHLSDPVQAALDALSSHGLSPKESGQGWSCRCPAHEDHHPSMSISRGDDGRVLLRCHKGCPPESIVAAIGLTMSDLFPPTSRPRRRQAAPRVTVDSVDRPTTTDLANADRFVRAYRDLLRYCHGLGTWLVWDGRRWCPDTRGTPVACAGEVARGIFREAAQAGDSRERGDLAKWGIKSESWQSIEAMVALARSRPELVVDVDDLDKDSWLLNVQNGTLDLRTGDLHPHRQTDLITKLAGTSYDEGAPRPLFDSFLRRIFRERDDLIGFVRRWHGLSLTGDIREQYLPIYFGLGANGKSVLVDNMLSIMGDYGGMAPPFLLTEQKGLREHPTEIANLRGLRFVAASETEDGASLKLQMVKRLTGDQRLKGRFMHGNYFEFARTHKLVLVTNNRPVVKEDTEGVWRRLRIVPFDVVIPESERNPQLLGQLGDESPAILAWYVQGCLDWLRSGLGTAGAITAATSTYRRGQNQAARFLDECCQTEQPAEESHLFTPWAELWARYQRWTTQSGERQLEFRDLSSALAKLGYPTCKRSKHDHTVTGRPGIRLIEPDEETTP